VTAGISRKSEESRLKNDERIVAKAENEPAMQEEGVRGKKEPIWEAVPCEKGLESVLSKSSSHREVTMNGVSRKGGTAKGDEATKRRKNSKTLQE